MYSSIIGTTEDRGSIEIDTDPGNLLCGNCCNRSRPLARQKYARASIPKICQSLNSQPIVSSFRQQRPLSIYLCSFLLDGRTREQREKEIPPTSLPPLLLTSSTNQQKPLSLSAATEEQLSGDLWIVLWLEQPASPPLLPHITPDAPILCCCERFLPAPGDFAAQHL